MRTWQAFDTRVNYLAFSPDGTRLVACGAGEGLKAFDSFTGQELWSRAGDDNRDYWHGQFTPDGRRVVALASGQCLVLDARDGCEIARHSRVLAAFAFLDNQYLLAVTRAMDTCELRQLHVYSGTVAWKKPLLYHGGIVRLALSPDRQMLATIGFSEVLVLELVTRKLRATIADRKFDDHRGHLAFSPDGRVLVYTLKNALHVLNTAAMKVERTVVHKGSSPGELAFLPDGRRLIKVGNTTGVQLWNADTWELATTYDWKAGKLTSAVVSPDGARAAVGSESGKIVVWDVDE